AFGALCSAPSGSVARAPGGLIPDLGTEVVLGHLVGSAAWLYRRRVLDTDLAFGDRRSSAAARLVSLAGDGILRGQGPARAGVVEYDHHPKTLIAEELDRRPR